MGSGVCSFGIGMINSTSNKQIKNLIQLQTKAKARREQGLFVVEGVRMFREAPKELLRQVYVSEGFYNKKENRDLLADMPVEVVSDRVFASAADTKTPQGILCVMRQRTYRMEELLSGAAPFLLLLENVQDPGNLGTIFRTAEAAGVTGILMSRDTADLYNPKTVRSTMGAIYRMPHLTADDLEKAPDMLRAHGIRTYAAHLQADGAYTEKDYRTGCAFLIGNEGNGLSEALSRQADDLVRIPMCGQTESLNAAVAAAVLMFEVRRQRDI